MTRMPIYYKHFLHIFLHFIFHVWHVCSVLGIIEKIQRLPYHQSCQVKQRYVCSPTNHFISQGHNCGFRNLQMLLSCLIKDAAYLRHVFSGKYCNTSCSLDSRCLLDDDTSVLTLLSQRSFVNSAAVFVAI